MDAVISMVNALLRGRVLTVTGLGRALRGETAPKHQIKKADRLIGNPYLHNERRAFYKAVISLVIGNVKRPIVLVDWSDVSDDQTSQKLRASEKGVSTLKFNLSKRARNLGIALAIQSYTRNNDGELRVQ
jgi:hypothetical protein